MKSDGSRSIGDHALVRGDLRRRRRRPTFARVSRRRDRADSTNVFEPEIRRGTESRLALVGHDASAPVGDALRVNAFSVAPR